MASTITLAAASSLSSVLPVLVARFRQTTGNTVAVRTTFGASGTIVRQLLAGAPIDVFLSAGLQEIKALQAGQSASGEGFGVVFAQNRLILAQPRSAAMLRSFADLRKLPAGFRVAMGKPDSVPAGRYARETLSKRGLWEPLNQNNNLVFTGTVRQAADAVASGNAQAAFIFATDARSYPKLKTTLVAVSGSDHEPIQYVAVVCPGARNRSDSARFLEFLQSKPGQQVLRAAGFLSP